MLSADLRHTVLAQLPLTKFQTVLAKAPHLNTATSWYVRLRLLGLTEEEVRDWYTTPQADQLLSATQLGLKICTWCGEIGQNSQFFLPLELCLFRAVVNDDLGLAAYFIDRIINENFSLDLRTLTRLPSAMLLAYLFACKFEIMWPEVEQLDWQDRDVKFFQRFANNKGILIVPWQYAQRSRRPLGRENLRGTSSDVITPVLIAQMRADSTIPEHYHYHEGEIYRMQREVLLRLPLQISQAVGQTRLLFVLARAIAVANHAAVVALLNVIELRFLEKLPQLPISSVCYEPLQVKETLAAYDLATRLDEYYVRTLWFSGQIARAARYYAAQAVDRPTLGPRPGARINCRKILYPFLEQLRACNPQDFEIARSWPDLAYLLKIPVTQLRPVNRQLRELAQRLYQTADVQSFFLRSTEEVDLEKFRSLLG